MKIVAVADLHGNLPEDVPECDLLVIAGDVCPDYNFERVSAQSKWLTSTFLAWLQRQSAKEKVAVWGNHDWAGEVNEFALPWRYLEDSETTVGNLRIYGTPYVPRFMDWAFMETEEQLKERFSRIPEGLDILVSHGPPLWACDRIGGRGDHIGSEALYNRLRAMYNPPKHVVCGHIHGGRGWGTVFGEHGSTQVWNVAGVDEGYTPHSPMWTEIELGAKLVVLEEGESSVKG